MGVWQSPSHARLGSEAGKGNCRPCPVAFCHRVGNQALLLSYLSFLALNGRPSCGEAGFLKKPLNYGPSSAMDLKALILRTGKHQGDLGIQGYLAIPGSSTPSF